MSAKTVATLVFGIAVLAGVLWVRKQYKDIEAGEATPPKAAPARVAKPQAEKPAAQITAPAATQASPGATHWFEGLPFGADEAAILAKFGGQAQKVAKPENWGIWYVDYVIPEYKLGGVAFEALFQMDTKTRRLARVLLRKQSENQPLGSYAADFKAVLAALTEKYGKPKGEFEGTRDANFREEQEWVSDPVTISLGHSQTVWPGGRNNEMLTVRYMGD
jgi:hypothetical protein